MTFREQAAIAAMREMMRARLTNMAAGKAGTITADDLTALGQSSWAIADALVRSSGPATQPGPYSEDR